MVVSSIVLAGCVEGGFGYLYFSVMIIGGVLWGAGGGLCIWLVCFMENCGRFRFLGVCFPCFLELVCAEDVLAVFCFCLEGGNCLLWYGGACVCPFLVDVVFWEV